MQKTQSEVRRAKGALRKVRHWHNSTASMWIDTRSRCTQSRLTCTRDIARKKRGPKKGSGSVIAKLRDEHDYAITQESGLPPFDLSQLEMQVPQLHRSYSNDSSLPSPLGSPLSAGFPEAYPPTSDPMMAPRSIPAGMNGTAPTSGFAQNGMQFPASWQIPPSELLQFQAPSSPTGYMTVNDLAQQIFQDTVPTSAPPPMLRRPLQPSPPKLESPLPVRPPSIDAILTSVPTTIPSPTTTAASSPMPTTGPKYLYRTESGHSAIAPQLMSLAHEIGMSPFLLSQCVKQYFRHVYAIRPFIHEPSFNGRLDQPEELSMEEKVFVLSLCAVTAVHDSPDTDMSLERGSS